MLALIGHSPLFVYSNENRDSRPSVRVGLGHLCEEDPLPAGAAVAVKAPGAVLRDEAVKDGRFLEADGVNRLPDVELLLALLVRDGPVVRVLDAPVGDGRERAFHP